MDYVVEVKSLEPVADVKELARNKNPRDTAQKNG
jgi:hypothetical protein